MSYTTAPSGNDWQHDLFGCFGDKRISILTCLIPCYTMGKNAAHLGESCSMIALLSCCGLQFGPITRWRLRQEKNLKGSIATDILTYAIVPCCALIQEAREIGWPDASSAMARS